MTTGITDTDLDNMEAQWETLDADVAVSWIPALIKPLRACRQRIKRLHAMRRIDVEVERKLRQQSWAKDAVVEAAKRFIDALATTRHLEDRVTCKIGPWIESAHSLAEKLDALAKAQPKP